jgi:hypothetical protein
MILCWFFEQSEISEHFSRIYDQNQLVVFVKLLIYSLTAHL